MKTQKIEIDIHKIEIDIHRERHIKLHAMLDELVADYISDTKKLLDKTTILELMQWAYEQTISPTGDMN